MFEKDKNKDKIYMSFKIFQSKGHIKIFKESFILGNYSAERAKDEEGKMKTTTYTLPLH